ncbi:MAG: hypothetical protein U1E43_01130 [Rhodospirillales bacterium]
MADVPDPRRAQGKRYPLPYLLMFTVLALLAGGAASPPPWRHHLPGAAPEHLNATSGPDLVRRGGERYGRCSRAADRGPRRGVPAPCQDPAAGGQGGQTADYLDGKTLRGSFDRFNDRKAAQTLTAFASASAIVLAHIEIDGKSNEIPATNRSSVSWD